MKIYNDELILFTLLSLCARTVYLTLHSVYTFFFTVWLVICSLNNKQHQVETCNHSSCYIIFEWKSIIPGVMPHENGYKRDALLWCVCVYMRVYGAKVNTQLKTKQLKLNFGNFDAKRWKRRSGRYQYLYACIDEIDWYKSVDGCITAQYGTVASRFVCDYIILENGSFRKKKKFIAVSATYFLLNILNHQFVCIVH